jgi:hypothetical protein
MLSGQVFKLHSSGVYRNVYNFLDYGVLVHYNDLCLMQKKIIMKTLNINAGIEYAKNQFFLPNARVGGVLVNADIGPISYGELHGADLPEGHRFVRFEAVGTDSRNGYDLVRTVDGLAYAIVTFSDHAKERGMDHLKKHIAANPDWYENRRSAWK